MIGVHALVMETLASSLTPSYTGAHREKTAVYEPGSRPSSPDIRSTGALLLDVQSLEP